MLPCCSAANRGATRRGGRFVSVQAVELLLVFGHEVKVFIGIRLVLRGVASSRGRRNAALPDSAGLAVAA